MAAVAATTLTASAAQVTIGGASSTDVDNWTTNDTAFVDPSPGPSNGGLAFDWADVTTNTVTVDSANNEFDYDYQASSGHTIGHGFLLNQTFDLSLTTNGIEGMTIDFDFESTTHRNWSPLIVVDGVMYRWNHSNNSFNGASAITIGNATLNAANTTWGQLVDSVTNSNWGGTRLNATNPDITATSGIVQFGFIQWGASSSGSANAQGSLTVDNVAYGITYTAVPEPSSAALVGLGGLALILRRRK